jgi:hypothetical protein
VDASTGELRIVGGATTLIVDPGAAAPPTADFDLEGAPPGTPVIWSVSDPAFGTIDQNGVFTPSGNIAGVVEIIAIVGDTVVRISITIVIEHHQNGTADTGTGGSGIGGLDGVGGEGFGGAVSDALVAVLNGPRQSDGALRALYPYDRTVFPLGILPPLLMWSEGASADYDAVYIKLSGSNYTYEGTFGRPAALPPGAPFVRHPVPKAVWRSATLSTAGKDLRLEIVLARDGQAYGPIERTFRIALAPVTGKIYYQAYGTNLAANWAPELTVTGERFGGATLSIGVGAESPELVAGTTSEDLSGCRVCHSVSAFGDRMVVQHGDNYAATSSIDLKNGNVETTPYQDGTVGWAGLYPDGTLGLANSIDVTGSNSNDGDTRLYDMDTGAVIASPGLNEFATRIGLPTFAHDGASVAFTLFEGPSTPAVGEANGRKLVSMQFDLRTMTFSHPQLLWEAVPEDERPAWPTYMPGSDAVVFQRRWRGHNDDTFSTWYGARGELWWVDLATRTARTLNAANGVGSDGQRYLPTSGNGHEEDERLNYEPSISPVASGGYAWMVFVSRRLYGNVATLPPWDSDPRDVDLVENVTTKKLWMAAIDLDAPPGTDPSHPAFYIPGQELHGVNSRPFFALDPCVSDAGRCTTGIDCCSGYCYDGYCVPQQQEDCSRINERCDAPADCCDPTARCIGGFCAVIVR